jgi:hypothetical protein
VSETSQGHGWWKASDGLFYPPETHPDYVPPPPPRGASYRPPPAAPVPPPMSPPSTTAPTENAPPPTGVPAPGPDRRVAIAFVGLAVVVLAAGVVAAIGLLASSDDATEASPATYDVARAPATAPADAFVTTGVETGNGVVIFGTVDDTDATDTQIWSSEVLTLGPGPAVQVGAISVPVGTPYLYGVTPTAEGFLGGGEIFFPDSGESQAAIFSSADGIDWSLAAAPGGVADADAVYDVAVVGDLALAVSVNDTEAIGSNRVYRSTDGGLTWEATMVEVATNFANAWGIGTDGEQFVIVGSTPLPSGGARPAIFRSIDGIAWTTSKLPAEFQGVLYDVAAVDGGFLAVGVEYRDGTDDALIFSSVDAENWRDLTTEADVTLSTDEAMYSVIPSGSGAVVTGLIDEVYGFWEVTVVEE